MSKPSRHKTDLAIRGVLVQSESKKKLSIKTYTPSGLKIAETNALIDCGAEGLFVDKRIVKQRRAYKLKEPIPVRNVDGSFNEGGEITHKILLPYIIEGVTVHYILH